MSTSDKKMAAVIKMMEISQNLDTLCLISGDEQTKFLAESLKLILYAGNDADRALLFSKHVINYLDEMDVVTGERTVTRFLAEKELNFN